VRTRIRNLIIKLMNEEDLWINFSPRITMSEINEIEKLGLQVQTEYIHGAESGSPRMAYALHLEVFREKAKKILGTESERSEEP